MQTKFFQGKHFLVLGLFGLFVVKSYALNPTTLESIQIKNDHQATLEQQGKTLNWIRELKNSVLQSTEPYFKTAQDLMTKSTLEDLPCGCAAQNDFFSTHQKTERVDTLSLPLKKQASTAVYVFVSLSMPKPALIALNKEAIELGATLILRGLKDNSYQKTALYLQDMIEKTGQGFLIHPELFKRYEIHQVPAVVLTKDTLGSESIFDIVSGHIPLKTALLEIAHQGELKNEAKDWLQRDGYAD